MSEQYTLPQLGWRHYFQQQLTLADLEHCAIARVIGQERSAVQRLTTRGQTCLPLSPSIPALTVGDWILLDGEGRFHRLLERRSLFSRKAAGAKVATQWIAANVDVLFIVSAMNQEFNLNRLERYLALANAADVLPVIVLTKSDLCDDAMAYMAKARALGAPLDVITVNSLAAESVRQLETWCTSGTTVAFLGSSGVGKSTLVNTLLGNAQQRTKAVRADDDKGRHTTTSRSLHLLPSGGLLLDTPGMRELQLADCEHGVEETFADITEQARGCRFTDSRHQGEPGCAVRAFIEAGVLEERRLASYAKLMREQARNGATLAERRAEHRKFGRYVRSVMESKRREESS